MTNSKLTFFTQDKSFWPNATHAYQRDIRIIFIKHGFLQKFLRKSQSEFWRVIFCKQRRFASHSAMHHLINCQLLEKPCTPKDLADLTQEHKLTYCGGQHLRPRSTSTRQEFKRVFWE